MTNIPMPQPGEYAPYAISYIQLVHEQQVLPMLEANMQRIKDMVSPLTDEQLLYRYAPGKWTIKEVLLHIMDAERIFAYRALRIGRGDTTALPGFEENDYAPQSFANERSKESIWEEYEAVRRSTITLLKNLKAEVYIRSAIVNGSNVSVRALAYCIAGHEQHHINILEERYFKK